jgi:hypothetical protein
MRWLRRVGFDRLEELPSSRMIRSRSLHGADDRHGVSARGRSPRSRGDGLETRGEVHEGEHRADPERARRDEQRSIAQGELGGRSPCRHGAADGLAHQPFCNKSTEKARPR